VADDGADLAAALATIVLGGDHVTLGRCVAHALDGAAVEVLPERSGHLEFGLSLPGVRRPLRAGELSDGQLRFLFLAAALLAPQPPGVLVLNEPESSLHEDVLPALAELIVAASARSQIIVTTHATDLAATLLEHEGTVAVALDLLDGVTVAQEL
jgi:predicted ATPase